MSEEIQKEEAKVIAKIHPDDPKIRFFLFSKRVGTLPPAPVSFDKADKAAAAGYFVSNTLLLTGNIKKVKTFQTNGIDCLEVTINDDMPWTSAFEKTIVDKLTEDHLPRKAMGNLPEKKENALYIHPDAIDIPDNLLDMVNDVIATSDEPVFRKIRDDGGLRATRIEQTPALKIHFEMSGRCATNCVNGTTGPTRSSIKKAIKSRWNYVADCLFSAAP